MRHVIIPNISTPPSARICRVFMTSMLLVMIGTVGFVVPGCQTTPKTTFSSDKPSRHSITSKHFVIQSDVRIEPDDAIVKTLENLHTQLVSTLKLPEQRDPVTVYLFSDEASYRYYMHATWRDLPPRRAYFVGSTRELAVYSFRSPQVMQDLRHEFAHGILHATLQTVPLWLDEGLAEYFEVNPETPGLANPEHLAELNRARQERWNPNLVRLEMLTDFRDLTQQDYAESWAWVHFLLNGPEERKDVLLKYLETLRKTKTPPALRNTLETSVPSYVADLQTHLEQLYASYATAGPLAVPMAALH